MSGRHTGEQHSHTVEGTDPQLYVQVHEPQNDAGFRPVLLLHGFSSSSKLNWEDSGWLTALLEAGRRVITVDLPGHGR
ncbi:alpha/beta fold hydrolase, partial [Microbacterium sp. Bi128]